MTTRMIKGGFLDISSEDLNSLQKHDVIDDLHASLYFRKKCINAGFTLTKIYPIYYQGWDMDEWGAIGHKDNKEYVLETNHGHLEPEQI